MQMLTGRTIKGVGWSVSTRLINRLIDFVTLLVLARALTPADFGLTALAVTLVAIVETVLEVALTQALTRLPKVSKSHLDTAFTLGLLRGIVFAVAVLIIAWPFAAFFHDARLLPLLAVLSIGPIMRGLYSPATVSFIRQLSFRETFFIQTASKVFAAGVTIAVLVVNGGYWAIAINSVAAASCATALSYVLAPYRPKLGLSEFREFSGFVGWFSLAQFVSALNWHLDRVLLGNFITKADLGRYTMASDLATMPTQSLIGPAMQPLMAAFATIGEDPERLRNAYLKASRFTMMLAMPAGIFIAMTADFMIEILLGAEWQEAAPYLQWLALSMLLNAYFQPLHSLSLAMNQARSLFRLNTWELAMRAFIVPLGFASFAVWGTIAARGALSVIMFFAWAGSARNLLGVTIFAQVKNLWQVLVACLALVAAIVLVREVLAGLPLLPFLQLGMVVALGAVIYLGSLALLGVRLTGLTRAAQT